MLDAYIIERIQRERLVESRRAGRETVRLVRFLRQPRPGAPCSEA